MAAEGFLVDAPGNQYGDGYFEGSMDDVVGLYIYIYLVMHFVNDDHLITICTIRRFCREKCEETL